MKANVDQVMELIKQDQYINIRLMAERLIGTLISDVSHVDNVRPHTLIVRRQDLGKIERGVHMHPSCSPEVTTIGLCHWRTLSVIECWPHEMPVKCRFSENSVCERGGKFVRKEGVECRWRLVDNK